MSGVKEFGPLVEGIPLVKGFIVGSLVSGAFTIPHGALFQAVLFVIAALVFLDAIIVFRSDRHLLSLAFMILISFIIGLAFAYTDLVSLYMVFTFVVMAILYLYIYLRTRG